MMQHKKDLASHCCLSRGKGTIIKGCEKPLDAGREKEMDGPLNLQEERSPTNTLILPQLDPF